MPAGGERMHIVLRGAVQGIGFCPTIYRIAQQLRLVGWVRDADAGIELEVQGDVEQLATFLHRLRAERPRTATVYTEMVSYIALQQTNWFELLPRSQRDDIPASTAVSPG